MKAFDPIREEVTVTIIDGEEYTVTVYYSELCYPVVIDNVEERFNNPAVCTQTRQIRYTTPNEAMKCWWKHCKFDKAIFIKDVLIPCLANFLVYEMSGEFSQGSVNMDTPLSDFN
jgi:hypothetical protein